MFRFLIFSALVASSLVAAIRNNRGLIPVGISAGVATTIEQFPYQVSIRLYGSHRCGGSIFKPTKILTAAPCVDRVPAPILTVVAGATNRHQGVERDVKQVIVHESFDWWEYDYDIAIVILAQGYEFGESIQALPLASINQEVRAGTRALMSGWGNLQEVGVLATNLHYVDVITISNEQCAKIYEGVHPVTNGMLCCEHPEGGPDSCVGDTGGPLVIGNKLVGITSLGKGCARAGVYTRVSAYREWINEKINNLENSLEK